MWHPYTIWLVMTGCKLVFFNEIDAVEKDSSVSNNAICSNRLTRSKLLVSNIVGDDGTSTEVQSTGGLMKDAENIYALWCTGRTYCEGMLVTLKLLKRQDLVSSIARLLRPVCDQIVSDFNVYSK